MCDREGDGRLDHHPRPARMTALDPAASPTAAGDARYRRQLLLVVMLAVMGFGSLMTIVTVSLSVIADDLDTTRTTLGWIVTGLMLTMAVSTPLMGKLGDIRGRRPVFLTGLAASVVATILCGLAWNAASLIAFRVLFGVCGAAVMPNGMALMMQAYGPSERARAMGWFQFAMTGAPTLGLVVGGPLVDVVGWRGLFFIFAGVTASAVLVAFRVVRPSPVSARTSLDVAGAATLGGGILALLLAVTRGAGQVREGASQLVSDPALWGLLAGAAVAFWAFVRIERRAAFPLLELDYFRRRNFTAPLAANAVNQFAYMGGFVVTPLLLRDVYGYSVGVISLVLAVRPGVFSLTSPLAGNVSAKVGERPPMLAGTAMMIASMVCFALGSTEGGLLLVLAGLALSGASAGIGAPAFTTLAASAVDPKDLGLANGMSQTTLYMGIVSGIQTMLVVLGDDPSTSRYAGTYLFGAAVACAAMALSLVARPGARPAAA
ncbi:MAG: MFS transporter [Acidimicrobiales bacterium]